MNQDQLIQQHSQYLRHLREQADGHRQGEAERNEAHNAVDGQQQSAVALQETQPEQVKTEIKGNVSLLRASIPRLFLDLEKIVMCRYGGAISHQLVEISLTA